MEFGNQLELLLVLRLPQVFLKVSEFQLELQMGSGYQLVFEYQLGSVFRLEFQMVSGYELEFLSGSVFLLESGFQLEFQMVSWYQLELLLVLR